MEVSNTPSGKENADSENGKRFTTETCRRMYYFIVLFHESWKADGDRDKV